METWAATESIFTELRSLSPLTTLLGRSFAASYADTRGLREEDASLTFFALMLAGYAARVLFQEVFGQPLLNPYEEPLDGLQGRNFDLQDPVGNANAREAVEQLADPAVNIALAAFEAVMTLPPDFWAGFISLATMQLQKNFRSRAVRARYLDRECIEGMIRYGYVLRCVDEAIRAEPEPPWALPRSTRARVRWGSLTNRPLSAHSDDELADVLWQGSRFLVSDLDMNEQTSRELAPAAVALFGADIWDGWQDTDRAQASLTAHVGLALRLAEVELFDDASNRKHPDLAPIMDVLIKMGDRARPEVELEDADEAELLSEADWWVIRSAHLFASEPETIQALLDLVPGTSRVVREGVIDRWVKFFSEKDAIPPGLDSDGLLRLAVYGYAVCAIRELFMAGEQASSQASPR